MGRGGARGGQGGPPPLLRLRLQQGEEAAGQPAVLLHVLLARADELGQDARVHALRDDRRRQEGDRVGVADQTRVHLGGWALGCPMESTNFILLFRLKIKKFDFYLEGVPQEEMVGDPGDALDHQHLNRR